MFRLLSYSLVFQTKKGCNTVLERICTLHCLFPMRILISTNTMQWRARIRTERIGPSNGQRPSSACTVRSCSPLLYPFSRPHRLTATPALAAGAAASDAALIAATCRTRAAPYRTVACCSAHMFGTYSGIGFGGDRGTTEKPWVVLDERKPCMGRTITSCQRLAFVLGISLGASTAW